MTDKIASTDKGQIEYSLKGQGPVILVLHGQSQDCRVISEYEAFISEGFSILVPSRPGYGLTAASVGDSAEKAADSIAALLNFLKIQQAIVLAVSGGGPTALFLAANYPVKVRKLLLVSALTKPWMDQARYNTVKKFYGRTYPMTWVMLRILSKCFPSKMARTTISLFSTHDPDDFINHISKQETKTLLRLYDSRASTAGPLIDIKSPPSVSVLNRISAPTLVVHSREDKSVSFENAEYSANNIKSAKLLVSPTWSHFPWFGPGADEELRTVLTFIKQT